jgi:hypothetical protein
MVLKAARVVQAIMISSIGASCYVGYYAIQNLHYKSAFCQYHRDIISFNSKKEKPKDIQPSDNF